MLGVLLKLLRGLGELAGLGCDCLLLRGRLAERVAPGQRLELLGKLLLALGQAGGLLSQLRHSGLGDGLLALLAALLSALLATLFTTLLAGRLSAVSYTHLTLPTN